MRRSGFILALAVVTAGCGQAAPQPEGEPPVQEQPLPDLAQIECEVNGARVLTPAVRPRADGVHLEVRNETGVELSFSALSVEGAGRGSDAPHPSVTYVWPLAPEKVFVKCVDSEADPSEIEGAPLEIVDQEGVWLSTRLHSGCRSAVSTSGSSIAGAKGERGDPVDVARRAFERWGLRPTDVVERAGYPEGEETIVGVLRDGRVVATLQLQGDGSGGWLTSGTLACTDPPGLSEPS